ncbi:MAG: Phosphatidylethanolamine N-methyltransferase [Candidatus Woesebacteria bacterium GW2011_GWA1_37_8]|uniref:Phosphatidylethanolamine N-methyltransferase n=2 Tax=Candidatus Woeseibacteriota TaxID=1752722 RepID=A0A0G0L4B0_9BACT|nr:MAG: Phosphatidylethanolamine N-methyltransferase [Candidatus Woesebacteria bacterium GW2011_GWA1_37_8]KKQ86818.1 MAG: Phosphatidylethanolamine N-methyltransferase [Candidatus Woesebacteria bacterium GW2011_GWB1_38_8b]
MSAHYDTYDYPTYWINREYEHKSELIALSALLHKIKKIKIVADYGAGFGRLVPSYYYRADKIILSDPSLKLLNQAKKKYKSKKIKFIHSRIENIGSKIKKNTVDLAIVVRVLHHIQNMEDAFCKIQATIKPGGYLILEFANKSHGKELLKQVIHGNLTFPLDIFSKDIRSKKNVKNNSIAFNNYHPDFIIQKLRECNFDILEKVSVSNIRLPFMKRHFPLSVLLALEKYAQIVMTPFNFGPSIFILAKKKIT